MNSMNWMYDEDNGRYVVKNARILFPNFEGAEQDYNQKGRRNFRLSLNEDLANELKGRGIFVRERPPRNEDEDEQRLVKVGVYPDAEVRFLYGRTMQTIDLDSFELVDREFRKGHILNGEIKLEFHVSRNTKVANGSYYLRLDTIILPIRKSKLLEEYEEEMDGDEPF